MSEFSIHGPSERGSIGAAAPAALVLAALLLCPIAQADAQPHGKRVGTSLEREVDATIRPGDDFFAYANGAWLRATEIPAGKDRWGARDEIDDVTRVRIMHLLDAARLARPGTPAREVANFRAAILNEAAIEARGLTPIAPQLDSIARLADKGALARMLGRGMRADVDPLDWGVFRSASVLGLSVEQSIHGEKTYVPIVVQGGLGLPDREYYVSARPDMAAARGLYRAYISRLLTLSGFDDSERRADAVMALEVAIAQTHATHAESANDHNADTVWTPADFAREAPGMDWSAYFAAAGLAGVRALVPWQPNAVRGVAALVASQPLGSWKDYLRVRAIDDYADVLPNALGREAKAFHDAVPNGEPQSATRVERAVRMTQLAMSDAIARMYVRRYFPAAQKLRVQAIAANVTAAFARRVEAVTWMAPQTRVMALAKLTTLYVGVGYPDHWPAYSSIVVDSTDPVGNLRRVASRNHRDALALLGVPVDKARWWSAPQKVVALLMFQQNAYDFSAALLQPTKFDPAQSDAANYGAIGATLAHDVTHFVDVLGAENEADGQMRHWWTAADMVQFQEKAKPLVDQYSAYHPYADVAIDGNLTRAENVADLGGLAAAFDAYRLTLGARAADADYVRRSDREFFLGFARSLRSRTTEAGMRGLAATSDRAPEVYRVSIVRNFDAWYKAFDVREGDRLYLAPDARARIW